MFLQSLPRARGPRQGRRVGPRVADVLRHGIGARQDTLGQVSQDLGVRRVRITGDGGWIRFDTTCGTRYGRCRASPATSFIIVLTLALAIGANTAVFSAVHTVLIRPLPYTQPESLVMLWEKREAEGVMKNSVSPADYLDWARIATIVHGDGGATRKSPPI